MNNVPVKGYFFESLHWPEVSDNRGKILNISLSNFLAKSDKDTRVLVVKNKYKGTIRGLHSQVGPHVEEKLIVCLTGSLLDVFIDLRRTSPTFSKCYSTFLGSKYENNSVQLPAGYLHGYQTLQNNTTLLYVVKGTYQPTENIAVNPFDKALSIQWPIEVTKISEADRNGISLQKFIDTYCK